MVRRTTNDRPGYIIVLCDSYQDSIQAFVRYVDFLTQVEPWTICEVNRYMNRVVTDADLCYYFIDRFMLPLYQNGTPADFVEEEDFFSDLAGYYAVEYCGAEERMALI